MGARLGPWRRGDLALLAALGLAAVGWDVAGLDLAVSAWAGGAEGFPLRNHWLASRVLHDGGRGLAAGALVALVASVLAGVPQGASRRERGGWLAVVLAGLVVVPLLKRYSHSSCPWDLAAFGGSVPYVGHWALGLRDGGPGHCFPSGHAVAAWAFVGVPFLWRPRRPAWAGVMAAVVVLAGLAFAAAQTVRGAHFVSHSVWSAWLCAALAVAAEPWLRPQAARTGPGRPGLRVA